MKRQIIFIFSCRCSNLFFSPKGWKVERNSDWWLSAVHLLDHWALTTNALWWIQTLEPPRQLGLPASTAEGRGKRGQMVVLWNISKVLKRTQKMNCFRFIRQPRWGRRRKRHRSANRGVSKGNRRHCKTILWGFSHFVSVQVETSLYSIRVLFDRHIYN